MALTIANDTHLPKDQRHQALRSILKLAKLNDAETWEIAFSKTLNVITQILDNAEDEMALKSYSLRILRELLIHYTHLFMNYIELTIFRILKAQSEIESEVKHRVDPIRRDLGMFDLSRSRVLPNKQLMRLRNIFQLNILSECSNQSSNRRNIRWINPPSQCSRRPSNSCRKTFVSN